jgi:hypothetical protein
LVIRENSGNHYLTSSTASIGVAGIVNFLLCYRAAGGRDERQSTLGGRLSL